MGLYDRLMGIDAANPKIPNHYFVWAMGEFARGQITGAQAQAMVTVISGAPLTAGEVTEATTLLATITNAGTAAQKLARAKEIEDVIGLAEMKLAPNYDTVAHLKTRLGV